ncbi:MAG: ammonium transporter [Neisseria sp.]|nr:ammonium transporter [Neisseria sp.]
MKTLHNKQALFALLASTMPVAAMAAGTEDWWKPFSEISNGDTAWVMTSAVLVLFMTIPGLALFYGGMVRKKNILSTMMHSFSVTALVSVLWMVIGYSLAFTPGNAFIGGLDRVFLSGIGLDMGKEMATVSPNAGSIPETVFMFFQMTFAVISTAIITGSFAERMKFSAMMLFSGLWMLLVYVPTAHWVWGGGFMGEGGVLDYAGGTVVHINAGIAGLVTAIVLGKRVGYGKEAMPPHNMALTLTGAAMLWVGWFGFNAGSAVAADASAGMAMAVTQIAAASAALTWLLCEKTAGHRPSALGLASGAVSGLVGITPAAGFVGPQGALAIGILTAIGCYFASVILKRKLGYDDSLDAFGIHGFGGLIGAVLTGVFFSNQIFGGEATVGSQVFIQLKDALTTVVYSGVVSFVILKIVGAVCGGLRVEKDIEREGLDLNIHGERVE